MNEKDLHPLEDLVRHGEELWAELVKLVAKAVESGVGQDEKKREDVVCDYTHELRDLFWREIVKVLSKGETMKDKEKTSPTLEDLTDTGEKIWTEIMILVENAINDGKLSSEEEEALVVREYTHELRNLFWIYATHLMMKR